MCRRMPRSPHPGRQKTVRHLVKQPKPSPVIRSRASREIWSGQSQRRPPFCFFATTNDELPETRTIMPDRRNANKAENFMRFNRPLTQDCFRPSFLSRTIQPCGWLQERERALAAEHSDPSNKTFGRPWQFPQIKTSYKRF